MSDSLEALSRALHEENPDIDAVVKQVTGNGEAVKLLIDGLTLPVETYRYNCNRVIVAVAESSPQEVYPHWDHLVELLGSVNTYHRCSAINVLPHLLPADREGRFDRISDRLFEQLDDQSVIPPCYLARNSPIIASHRPDLVQRIAAELLSIEATHHAQGRKDLIKADVIAALDQLFDRLENRDEVLRFVEAQLGCSSPKTRKAAKTFLNRHRASHHE
jgi:hypothetical protein